MAKILWLSASPRKEFSGSTKLARAFLDEYAKAHPGDVVEHVHLWDEDLPEFGLTHTEAKFAPILGTKLEDRHHKAWARVIAEIDRFKAADKVLVSSPMWNYSIPYKLKHYLDLICQPRLTFGYDPKTMAHFGLVANKPLQLILTRSSVMPGDAVDHQLPYLTQIFHMLGINDIRALLAWRTTKPTQEARDAYIESFIDQAREAARAF